MIEVLGLTKRYGDTTAVDDLSFTVRPGHVTGFLGPNGSGKSTTMRLVLGLDTADGGEAHVHGQRYRELRWPLREVGALLDARAFHPGRTAFHHLVALAQTNRISRSRVDDVLELVGLASVGHKRAGSFSLGMAQRLGIAAALLGDPGVLLFGEPINGLDPEGIIWVRSLLKRLASEGRTAFVSSHLISEMALCADRLVVIGRRRLITETAIAELVARSPGRYVKVRTRAEAELVSALGDAGARVRWLDDGSLAVEGRDADAVAELAAARRIVLNELSTHSPSLEDAYLELTNGSVEYQGRDLRPKTVTDREAGTVR